MRKLLFLFSLSILAICITVYNNYAKENAKEKMSKVSNMKIRISINNTELTATMFDNPTVKDFISLLPLTLKLEDYADTEKISQLPKKLSLLNAPSGSEPSAGDITYYSPWGNMAIFYKDFSYAKGLILLGKLDSNVSIFKNCKYPCVIKIEKIIENK